ncbi:hypothetical protein HT576_18860 [Haloterrigena sp. SYSU A121-1]|uniref:Uncharacterized protein n=1 Tax=Haloterrigena gelatinilytica TaxID=2741724 RepID=A0A8J8KH15_9EURY|nr:hypothetical protein [Haloterrigena gelatinilytica]NUB93071.1 hypothetical protein [Haloterrigena gelatinilytica]
MPMFEEWTLWLHIEGDIALFAGVGALMTKKGGLRYTRRKVFLVSIGGVVGMVFILLPLDPTPFRVALPLVAIFKGYIAFSGSRAFSHPRIGVLGCPMERPPPFEGNSVS